MLLEMNVFLYMHVLSQSHFNVPIGALGNVLCLCIYLMREGDRGHTSERMTMIEKKNMDYLFFVHHSSNNRKRIEFSIKIGRQQFRIKLLIILKNIYILCFLLKMVLIPFLGILPTKKIFAKKRGQSRFFPSQRGIP